MLEPQNMEGLTMVANKGSDQKASTTNNKQSDWLRASNRDNRDKLWCTYCQEASIYMGKCWKLNGKNSIEKDKDRDSVEWRSEKDLERECVREMEKKAGTRVGAGTQRNKRVGPFWWRRCVRWSLVQMVRRSASEGEVLESHVGKVLRGGGEAESQKWRRGGAGEIDIAIRWKIGEIGSVPCRKLGPNARKG
ncbi:hypothetical protein CK203_002083 [Vitis vinifera]|uniref:Uncharacterized protein n=1 Tax=Vitis vinifera TaxID=29760 RepID=A0A438KK18_VITVI|nr:hypothetical protein CK203_002083 [Vitis vinifera]